MKTALEERPADEYPRHIYYDTAQSWMHLARAFIDDGKCNLTAGYMSKAREFIQEAPIDGFSGHKEATLSMYNSLVARLQKVGIEMDKL